MKIETITPPSQTCYISDDGHKFLNKEACLDHERKIYIEKKFNELTRIPFIFYDCCEINSNQEYIIVHDDEEIEIIKEYANKITQFWSWRKFHYNFHEYPAIVHFILTYNCNGGPPDNEAELELYSTEEFKELWNKQIAAIQIELEKL